MVRVEAAEQIQQLGDGQARVQRNALQLDADALLDGLGVPAHVEPEHLDGARVGRAQAFQDLDRGRLAGPVGTQHPEDLASRDLEGDPVDGFDVPVVLLQVFDADDGLAALRHLTPWLYMARGSPGSGALFPMLAAPPRVVLHLANDRLSAADTTSGSTAWIACWAQRGRSSSISDDRGPSMRKPSRS